MRAWWNDGAWIEARSVLRGQHRALAAGLALMLVNRLAALVVPASSKWVIDDVIGKQRVDLLPWLAAGAGAAVLIETGSAFGLSQSAGAASERAVTDLRRGIFGRMVGLPMGFHDGTRIGASLSRIMTDPEAVRDVTGSGMLGLASALLTASIAFGMLFHLNPGLTAVLLVVLFVYGAALARGFSRLYPEFRMVSEATAELAGRVAESLGGIRVVKAFGAERREEHVVTRESHRLLRRCLRALCGASAFRATSTMVTGVVSVLLLAAGARAVLGGVMTVGEVVMYVFFTGLLMTPLVQISAAASELSKARAALGRIHDIKALATEEEEDSGRAALPRVVGAVEFHDVNFGYVPDRLVLRRISLHAPAGCTLALVGPTGSGKSTVCWLLAAFARPSSGRVLVDGCDLAAIRRSDYRKHLGVVLQETFLFDGSVEDNIRYGAPGASETAFHAAVRMAHCEEFIRRFPYGYETRVGERGVQLSGGQRQRVAIARALLKDPRILILDEATSHLDSESEALVQDGLRALRRGRTTFVIAHRLETVRGADQILVMEGGEIVARGRHRDLIGRAAWYSRLCAAQDDDEPRHRFQCLAVNL